MSAAKVSTMDAREKVILVNYYTVQLNFYNVVCQLHVNKNKQLK